MAGARSGDDGKKTRLGVVDAQAALTRPIKPRSRARTPRPDPHDALIGALVLERYRIEAKLGAGATGSVFRGRHVALPRGVAIKILHDEVAREPTMLARFRREAEAAGRLHHPNLSGVIDFGATEAGQPLIVMELVEGPSLRAVMDGEPLPHARIVHLVRHILRGLDHAHAAGLVHRDLKPDNVIVAAGDVPRIVDFGIAALCTDEAVEGGRLTETGTMLGTPLYMAPEQARGERVDPRVDLFALGVMVFEMIAGTTPFDGSALEVVVANMEQDLPAIAARAPTARFEPVLELFLRKLAARDKAARFASANDALAMLDAIDADPADAAVRLGQTDVTRALDVVRLPCHTRRR
ncbi:MAG TPA: serine/threonine-protein kinase [Kofleriaceae bacterium]|nr:serine/threonine-protein kinase [Kofleriaceae bacterium]